MTKTSYFPKRISKISDCVFLHNMLSENRLINRVSILYTIAVIISGISGCAVRGINISENKEIPIESTSSSGVLIPWANAQQDGENLVITGVVEQRCACTGSQKTRILVEVTNAKGEIIKQTETREINIPRRRSGISPKRSRFTVLLPVTLREGTKIKLTAHDG